MCICTMKVSHTWSRKDLLSLQFLQILLLHTHRMDQNPWLRMLNCFNYPFSYLYDKDGRRPFELVYHGQFDDSRTKSNVPVTGRDLSRGTDSIQSGQQFHKFRNQVSGSA
ncbi:unnamed protein product [Linum trigynum]|uniref:Uncharacterized protein n=1 Tax=Linum trigynum TaxID=586398 RepID=A0AAV2D0T5_9ROSI